MNQIKLDARGLNCPEPVLMVKNNIENQNPDLISILVDNQAAMENVTRFLESRHYSVETISEGDDYKITGKIKENQSEITPEQSFVQKRTNDLSQKIMVLISSNRIGSGDDDLGENLMINFLKTLREMGDELWHLVFVNNGVKLTIENSRVLDALVSCEKQGTKILVCGTCLTHFNLMDQKKVGETTNMLDIVTAMQLADKVINL